MPAEAPDTVRDTDTAAGEGGAAANRPLFTQRYDNFVGGEVRAPKAGRHVGNPSPVTRRPICDIARTDGDEIEAALGAAHAAKDG